MKKQIIVLSVLIILTISSIYLLRPIVEQDVTIVGDDCLLLEDQYLAGNCLTQKALDSNDTDYCMQAPSSFTIGECLTALARKLKDLEVCKTIPSVSVRDNCLHNIAIITHDPTACNEIKAESSLYRCIAFTGGDVSICDAITSPSGRDWCVMSYSSRRDDASLCDSIKDNDVRDECYLSYIRKHMFDPTICKKIRGMTARKTCEENTVTLVCPINAFRPKYGKPL